MPIILATQEAEIRRVLSRSQSWANNLQDLISKNPITATAKKLVVVPHVVRTPA
jgi:hypothetical protein